MIFPGVCAAALVERKRGGTTVRLGVRSECISIYFHRSEQDSIQIVIYTNDISTSPGHSSCYMHQGEKIDRVQVFRNEIGQQFNVS